MIFCITVTLDVLSFLLYTTVTVNTKNENKIEFNFPSGLRERGTSAYEDAFNEQPSAHTKKSCQ